MSVSRTHKKKMIKILKNILLVFFIVEIPSLINATLCGCKEMRPCYKDMIDALKDKDEEACVEDASIGVSTVMIFLKAIKQFCPDIITIYDDALTYEGRRLYEVLLSAPAAGPAATREGSTENVIVIEAGQNAGTESVGLALVLIEQLVACQENHEMLSNVKWVILPSVNPDGMEYGRYNRGSWKKNVKPSEDGLSYGVDISRNFDSQWGSCEQVESGFAMDFPGPSAASENETIFIKNVLSRYKKDLKLYLSIRRDGHAILYPHGYTKSAVELGEHLIKTAGDVAAKVNQRAGGVQVFLNESIFDSTGKPHCGHSVDYALEAGIRFAFEMRVFLGNDNRIMAKFQQLPPGYEASLRLGYLSGIRELYNAVAHERKSNKVFY